MSPQALPNGLPPWAQLHACLDSLDAEVLTVGSCTSKLRLNIRGLPWCPSQGQKVLYEKALMASQ